LTFSAPPKIGDVARRAGVSTATVSRTLSLPESVRPETRKKVLEAVRDLGYTPNAAARNLRAGNTMMALVVLPKLANSYFAEVVRGIDDELAKAGYGLVMGDLDNIEERERHMIRMASAGHVDGVLVMTGRMPQSGGRSLDMTGLPIVAIASRIARRGVPNVLVNESESTMAQVRHLVDLGHRRIAYLSGPQGNTNDLERWAGFQEAVQAARLAPEHTMRIEGDYTFEAGGAAGRFILGLDPAVRPTGVVAASDAMAIGLMKEIRKAGLSVPRDLSVIGFDGIEFASYCEPELTTIRQPRRALGEVAARTLLAAIEGGPVPGDVILPTELQLGGSTGPAPTA
jgi:LacI family repressor for deo operon, udp, cdd, tsx, nupC, and nupG